MINLHLGLIVNFRRNSRFFQAKSIHFEKFKTSGLIPPYLGLSPKVYQFLLLTPSLIELGWGEGLSLTLFIVGLSNMCLITCTSSGKVETHCEEMSQFCHRLQIQEDALPTEDAANSAALSQISPFLPVAWVGWPKYKYGIIRTFRGYFPFCRKTTL